MSEEIAPPVTAVRLPDPTRDPARANLRAFLEKLARRRKTIVCSAKCRKTIEDTLKKLGGKGLANTGRIRLDDLKEMLREPPAGVPPQTLREFVDIVTAYDVGDGSVDLREVLKFALQSEPGILQRMSWILPLLVLLIWLLLGPAVFCPAEGWSYLDGLYLSVLSLSTVGTGGGLSEGSQVYPRSVAAQVFLLVYVLIGAVLTIWFLLSLSLALLPLEQRPSLMSLRSTPDLLAEDGHGTIKGGLPLEDLVGDHPATLPPKCEASEHASDVEKGLRGPLREESAKPKSIVQIHKESLREWAKPRAKTLQAVAFWGSILLEVIVILAAGTAIVLLSSTTASFLDAFSWAVLTGLTIGYGLMASLGDGVNQNLARGLQIAYVLLAVFGILHMTFKIGRRCLRQRAEAFERRIKERILPADLLADLDKTGGGVNRLEFLCAALLTSDRVSGHDLSLALEMFQRLDPNGSGLLRSPQLEAFRRPDSKALTLSELLESPQLHSQLEVMQFPAKKSMMDERTTAVLQEVYKDYDAVRRSLDAKDDELLQALKEHGASEQARAQAVAQREAMRKEVAILSQAKTDLLQRVDKEAQQNKEAQAAVEDLKSRHRSLEQKLRHMQLEHDEVNNRLTTATRQLKEVQHLNHEYQRRSQEAEREIQDFPRRLKEQAECLQHEADIRVNQVRLEAAEQNLERQGEMQSAQLELKALSSSMEAMRGQLKQHSLSPTSPEGPNVGPAPPLRTGLQWDVWSRPSWSGDASGLLSEGKVKQHLEFLDSQVRRQVDHLGSQALSGGL